MEKIDSHSFERTWRRFFQQRIRHTDSTILQKKKQRILHDIYIKYNQIRQKSINPPSSRDLAHHNCHLFLKGKSSERASIFIEGRSYFLAKLPKDLFFKEGLALVKKDWNRFLLFVLINLTFKNRTFAFQVVEVHILYVSILVLLN